VAALIAALAGLAVGVDARPDPRYLGQTLAAGGATIIGASALAVIVAGLVLGRGQGWQRGATRLAGSWITARAIHYSAWHFTSAPA
jgi:hypothetical protein